MMKVKPSKLQSLTNKLYIIVNVYVYFHQAEDHLSVLSLLINSSFTFRKLNIFNQDQLSLPSETTEQLLKFITNSRTLEFEFISTWINTIQKNVSKVGLIKFHFYLDLSSAWHIRLQQTRSFLGVTFFFVGENSSEKKSIKTKSRLYRYLLTLSKQRT